MMTMKRAYREPGGQTALTGDRSGPSWGSRRRSGRRTPRWRTLLEHAGTAGAFDRARSGFTLIELLVVLAVVALLLTVALPRYFQGLDIAKERVLLENLRTTREAIDRFFADTGRYPESLEELTEKRYLKAAPFDPIVESSARWTLVPPAGESNGRVYDLKSSAEGVSRSGKPFAEL